MFIWTSTASSATRADEHILVYGDERVAKYLMNERYVLANFNAVMIGSSVSANWRLDQIVQLRTFNNSVNGGNIVEEKSMVDQVLYPPPVFRLHC